MWSTKLLFTHTNKRTHMQTHAILWVLWFNSCWMLLAHSQKRCVCMWKKQSKRRDSIAAQHNRIRPLVNSFIQWFSRENHSKCNRVGRNKITKITTPAAAAATTKTVYALSKTWNCLWPLVCTNARVFAYASGECLLFQLQLSRW